MLALDQTADATAIERLAVLLHDIGKPSTQEWSEVKGRFQFLRHESVGADMVEAVMRRLKFSRIEIDTVHFAVKNHMKMHQFSRMGEAKKIALMKHQFSDILKTVAIADSASTGDDTVALRAELDRLDQISVPEPLITGDDLLAFGIPEGKRIGKILRIVREKQIEGKINTVADALKTAKGIA
jgi:putative nucleotidyltransferase with HDIG domain